MVDELEQFGISHRAEIDGALRISGNSGNINLAQSSSDSVISGNSGTTTIKLRQLDAGGLKLRGNSGPVKLYRQAAIRDDHLFFDTSDFLTMFGTGCSNRPGDSMNGPYVSFPGREK